MKQNFKLCLREVELIVRGLRVLHAENAKFLETAHPVGAGAVAYRDAERGQHIIPGLIQKFEDSVG